MVATFIDSNSTELNGSGINEENHIGNGSWIAWLIDDSIGAILSPTILS